MNFFFTQEEVEGNENESKSTPTESTETTPVDQTPVTSTLNVVSTGDGVFDQKFAKGLQELISENNIPGIDYFEFREALKGMTGVSENTSFPTTFNTLKVVDPTFTKEKLLSSVDFYDNLLSNEEKEFAEGMTSEIENEVTSRKNKAESLKEENAKMMQDIQNLNEKIAANQSEAIKLSQEASVAEANISQIEKNFAKTISQVKNNLSTDKEKISQLVIETKTA